MCCFRFVWLSETTEITFITERKSVYCAVRAEALNKIQVNFVLKGLKKLGIIIHVLEWLKDRIQSRSFELARGFYIQRSPVFNTTFAAFRIKA
jgi:hypothetical protein